MLTPHTATPEEPWSSWPWISQSFILICEQHVHKHNNTLNWRLLWSVWFIETEQLVTLIKGAWRRAYLSQWTELCFIYSCYYLEIILSLLWSALLQRIVSFPWFTYENMEHSQIYCLCLKIDRSFYLGKLPSWTESGFRWNWRRGMGFSGVHTCAYVFFPSPP